jgi:hypothetical protein
VGFLSIISVIVHFINLKTTREYLLRVTVRTVCGMAVKLALTPICYFDILDVHSNLTHLYTSLRSHVATSKLPSVISTHAR